MTNFVMDFEMDDSLLALPPVTTNKRRKVIGLDDLFNEHKIEQEKGKKKKSKVVKARKVYASDDDDDAHETEHKLTEALQDFQKTIKEVDGQEVALNELDRDHLNMSWGLQVFGAQKSPSPLAVNDLGGCMLLQNFERNELHALVDYDSDMAEEFLKGLLLNGWLSKLIIKCRYLEESIAKWTFNLLMYSSDESLMTSACELWSAILLCDKADEQVLKIEWLPSFLEMNRALEIFGMRSQFLFDVESSHGSEQSNMDSVRREPPTNVRAWIKFLNASCQVRNRYPVFSTIEAEKIVGTVVCLFLDRQLLGLTAPLHDCLRSAINFFEEKEWNNSCEKIAKLLADRVPSDSNCLRMIECISGVDSRSKQLRSIVASHILGSCFDEEMDMEEILKFLISTNLKAKSCDLFKIYLNLVLVENWLVFGEKAEPAVDELWRRFIWKCSSQISNTDFRPCAQEIRSRASYLLQSTSSKQADSR